MNRASMLAFRCSARQVASGPRICQTDTITQPCRKPRLRLVITSATLDGEKFSTYFRDCPVFSIPGRCFEVAVVHAAQVTSAHTSLCPGHADAS